MAKVQKAIQPQAFGSVWDATSDTLSEAEHMKVRSALMTQIVDRIKRRNLSQVDAAKLCQVTQPCMSDLIQGRISKFSLDALINIAASAGLHIRIEVQEDALA